MPRTPITNAERAAKVRQAIADLPSILALANSAEANGHSDADKRAAWAQVEEMGAIVHRQSRLLAGKSKGG